MSVLDGYFRIEHLSWDAYKEVRNCRMRLSGKKEQAGVYPQGMIADKIYRTRDKLRYCAKHGIHMNSPKLRPPQDKALYAQQCSDERRELGESNEVEGKYLHWKAGLLSGANFHKAAKHERDKIHMIVLTMNLWEEDEVFFYAILQMDRFTRFIAEKCWGV